MTRDEAIAAAQEFVKTVRSIPEAMFNGAYLVLPPNNGDKVDGAVVSSNPDLGTFWPYCAGIVQVELHKIQEAEREAGPGYRGRLR